MTETKIPMVELNDGHKIPITGMGTWKNFNVESMAKAIDLGVRHIDTAYAYDNEGLVGQALKNTKLDRDEIILATKVWPSDFGRDKTIASINRSLKSLDVDYIDILYLHWPAGSWSRILESWEVLQEAKDKGIVNTLAVCNFEEDQLEKLIQESGFVPAINQMEIHPYLQNTSWLEAMRKRNILPQAHSPLAHTKKSILGDPVLADLGEKYDKSPAQIILRWHYQRKVQSIAKTEDLNHLVENQAIYDFNLSIDDMEEIEKLDRGEQGRTSGNPKDQAWLKDIAEE